METSGFTTLLRITDSRSDGDGDRASPFYSLANSPSPSNPLLFGRSTLEVITMKILTRTCWLWFVLFVNFAMAVSASAQTEPTPEHHTATRLGNPATVFAPTIYTVDQM